MEYIVWQFLLRTEYFSLLIWDKLDRCIGTKEQVFVRRRRNILTDSSSLDYIGYKEGTIQSFSGGSRSEGVLLPGSDHDQGFIIRTLKVLPIEHARNRGCDLFTESMDTKPGYVKLRVKFNQKSAEKLGRFIMAIQGIDDIVYLKSSICRDISVQMIHTYLSSSIQTQMTSPHGPCASFTGLTKTEFDQVVCFPCMMWPQETLEWINRVRPNNWPPTNLVEQIVADGCLLVPIGHPVSQVQDFEWRISFNFAERRLVYSMNHTQLLCYGLLKLYLKHVIEANSVCKELLSSYMIKTCLFYCIEEDRVTWDKSNLLLCFWVCFKRLYSWIRQGYCPNYFIRENNMFEGKISKEQQKTLLKHFSELYADGVLTILRIPILSEIVNQNLHFTQTYEYKRNTDEMFCDIDIIDCHQFFADVNISNVIEKAYFFQRSLLNVSDPFDKMWMMILNFCNNVDLVQLIFQHKLQRDQRNIHEYKIVRMLTKCIVKRCTFGDMCTGWLQFATLCYLTGQYSRVIMITKNILNRFQNHTIYKGISKLCYNEEFYTTVVCGRGISVQKKLKHILACPYIVLPCTGFYPNEIEPEIQKHSSFNMARVSPLVYCQVLLCLSFRKMGLRDPMRRVVLELRDNVSGNIYCRRFVEELERPLCIDLYRKCEEITS